MIRRLAYCAIPVAVAVGYAAGRLATPPDAGLRMENRRLRHDNAFLTRHGKGLRHALTTSERYAARLSAWGMELQLQLIEARKDKP